MVDLKKMNKGRNPKLASAKKWLEDINAHMQACSGGYEFSDWETDFIESIEEQMAEGNGLSPAQLEKLEEIWDKLE